MGAGTVNVLATYSDEDCFELFDSIRFKDPRVRAPLQQYNLALQSISAAVKTRNKKMIEAGARHFDYPYLDPQKLTTSVAIRSIPKRCQMLDCRTTDVFAAF